MLTPGIYNSAYFEHAFLADQMGVELVEGQDLRVVDGHVAMRTTEGYKQIDVLYRRVDDDFLDPLTFRPDSTLGVPGIMDVYRAGNITIANAPGHRHRRRQGDLFLHARDRRVLHRPQGRSWTTSRPGAAPSRTASTYVLEHLDELVVKEVHGSGGYGMLVGPTASSKEREEFAKKLAARPGNYIAQPTLVAVDLPDPDRSGPRAAPCRPQALSCWSPTASRSCPAG